MVPDGWRACSADGAPDPLSFALNRMGQHLELCSSPSGAVVLSANYLHATNITIDLNRSMCSVRERRLFPGFLGLPCEIPQAKKLLLDGHLKAIINAAANASQLSAKVAASRADKGSASRRPVVAEDDFTVFVTRDDMGNFAQ